MEKLVSVTPCHKNSFNFYYDKLRNLGDCFSHHVTSSSGLQNWATKKLVIIMPSKIFNFYYGKLRNLGDCSSHHDTSSSGLQNWATKKLVSIMLSKFFKSILWQTKKYRRLLLISGHLLLDTTELNFKEACQYNAFKMILILFMTN